MVSIEIAINARRSMQLDVSTLHILELTPFSISTLALMNEPAVGICRCGRLFPVVGEREISGDGGAWRGGEGEKESSGENVVGTDSGDEMYLV